MLSVSCSSILQGDNMQKYLNIDPMDGGTGLQEGAGLLGQLPGLDDEPPSMPTQQQGALATPAGPSSSSGSSRLPAFGPGGAVAMTTPVSSGYLPPPNPFAASDRERDRDGGYELASGAEGTSNPLAQAPRYPAPTISAAGAGPAGLFGPPPAPAGTGAGGAAASASKSKKAMKEPKSMRSST